MCRSPSSETLETACLCSSSCSSLGRAVARVVRRRRRRACTRAGRRRSPPAGTATARRLGRDAGSRRLRARLQGSSTSFLTPRSSLATSSGGEAWATGPIRRRAARKHPTRPRPQRRGWREPPSSSRREWRNSSHSRTSKMATRARCAGGARARHDWPLWRGGAHIYVAARDVSNHLSLPGEKMPWSDRVCVCVCTHLERPTHPALAVGTRLALALALARAASLYSPASSPASLARDMSLSPLPRCAALRRLNVGALPPVTPPLISDPTCA